MAINVTTSQQQITASVAEDKISANVSAGFGATGPQGPSGVIEVTAPITNSGTTTAANVGLSVGTGLAVSGGSLVLGTHTHDDRYYTETEVDSLLSGYATLVGGKVPSAQLPSYVDDVIEVATFGDLPSPGESGKIYLVLQTNKVYRWTGFVWLEIVASPGSTDSLAEGSVNLYYTNTRAAAAAPVQSVSGKTGAVVLAAGDIASGTLSASRLPLASSGTRGAVRIGSGISIDGDGVISVSTNYAASSHTHNASEVSYEPLGVATSATDVQSALEDIENAIETRIGAGQYATTNDWGIVKIGSGVSVLDGVISVSTAYAAASHTHDASAITAGTLNASRLPASVVQRVGSANAVTVGPIISLYPIAPEDVTEISVLSMAVWDGVGYETVFEVRGDGLLTFGTIDWASVINVPATYAPSAHKASHATGGSDALTASDIGAASLSHAHGAITSDGKVGSTAGLVLKTGTAGAVEALAQGTAGQVLKVNSGATGVEWGAAAADVSIDASAADVLSASSGSITADDAGADKLVFWDDSAGKLTYLAVSTGLSISGTTFTASVSASDISQGTLAYARMADPTVTSPSQIASDQNNYTSFARGINRFSTDAARTMTGVSAGNDGELRILSNIGSFALTLAHESSSSTAANRFATPTAANYSVPPGSSVAMFYDGTSSRWRVL